MSPPLEQAVRDLHAHATALRDAARHYLAAVTAQRLAEDAYASALSGMQAAYGEDMEGAPAEVAAAVAGNDAAYLLSELLKRVEVDDAAMEWMQAEAMRIGACARAAESLAELLGAAKAPEGGGA